MRFAMEQGVMDLSRRGKGNNPIADFSKSKMCYILLCRNRSANH